MSRGKVHDYLVMQLNFGTCLGSMIISMIKYLQKILDKWPEVLGGTKACPATDNFFKVREEEDRETYGPKTTISRSKVHDYLVMQLNFGTCPGSMIISMIKYLQKILDKWPEVLGGTKA